MTMPSYIINWEELTGLLEDLSEDLTSRGIKDVNGTQKAKGFAESIPAIQAEYKVVNWTLPYNIVITGVSINQTSWVGDDYWELWINEELIFESVYTKELGEQKHWEVVHPVAEGMVIEIILHNESGNSRDIWADIEYLEVGDMEMVEPEEPESPEDGELIPDPDPIDPDLPVDPEEPEEPDESEYSATVRVRYLNKNTLASIKAQRVYLNQSGILNFTGDEIDGWTLLDPKNKTIEIVDNGDYVVDFLYNPVETEPSNPDIEEPTEPDSELVVHFNGILIGRISKPSNWEQINTRPNGTKEDWSNGANYLELRLKDGEDVNIPESHRTHSNLLPVGEYPNGEYAIPNAHITTLDSIAVPSGLRLQVFEHNDFKGKVLLDVTGNCIIYNHVWIATDFRMSSDFLSQSDNQRFPQSVRSKTTVDMRDWKGSYIITKV